MLFVRYLADNEFSITAVADISFSGVTNRIDFVPVSECSKCFYIPDCTLDDFEVISGALRHESFINLYAFGYKVLFD